MTISLFDIFAKLNFLKNEANRYWTLILVAGPIEFFLENQVKVLSLMESPHSEEKNFLLVLATRRAVTSNSWLAAGLFASLLTQVQVLLKFSYLPKSSPNKVTSTSSISLVYGCFEFLMCWLYITY